MGNDIKVKEGICSVEAVERALAEGHALRWAFMGPYGTSELTSGLLTATLTNFFINEQKQVENYSDEFVERVQEEIRTGMNGMSHDEYAKWRGLS